MVVRLLIGISPRKIREFVRFNTCYVSTQVFPRTQPIGRRFESYLRSHFFASAVFYVYVIRSQPTGRIYVGHTSNLPKRLAEHNDPENHSSRFTKRFPGPWILVYKEILSTRSEAFRRERWLKSGKGRQYLKSILGVGC